MNKRLLLLASAHGWRLKFNNIIYGIMATVIGADAVSKVADAAYDKS